MKRLALVCAVIGGLVAGTIPALAQNPNFSNNIAGRFVASEYGKWAVTTLNAVSAGSQTVSFAPCFQKAGSGNRQFFPFWQNGAQALNVPIQVQDLANSELISTESAASYPTNATIGPTVQAFVCSITATFANAHAAGVTITSGDGGLEEAINDAASSGAGAVTLDSTYVGTPATALVYPSVQIEDLRGPQVQYWNASQGAATFLAVPTTLTSTTAAPVAAPVGGYGTGTYHLCISYVDIMGNEGACSLDFSEAGVATGSFVFTAPAASTGAVGYTIYISLTSGTYALAYQVPLTSAICNLTKLETVTPACAVSNTAYGQAGATATVTAITTNTAPIALQLGAASTTADYVGNSNARTTYVYALSTHPEAYGIQGSSLAFTAGPATVATTVPQVIGTLAVPAGFLNTVGKTIRVCGKLQMTNNASATVEAIQLWLDGAGSNAAGVPVNIANIQVGGTGTAVAYNGAFCWTGHTTVSGAGVTAGSVQGDNSSFILGIAAAPVGSYTPGADTFTAATASLNLAGGAGFSTRLHLVQLHTGGNDVSPKLVNATVEVLN